MTRAEYDRAVPELVCYGLSVAHEGAIPGSGLRFIYFATDSVPGGPLYEISEAKEPSEIASLELPRLSGRQRACS